MTNEELKTLSDDIRERARLELNTDSMEDDDLRSAIDELVDRCTRGVYLTLDQRLSLVNDVYASYRGFGGLLDSIMLDEAITEVMINGHKNIFVERKGRITKMDAEFKDDEELRNVIKLIVGRAGREVSQADPIVDTRLPDGSRVNVVLAPIALDGSTMTIRKFSAEPMTMARLIGYGSVTPEIAAFLEKLVRARYNIFISGGTGSGKTTFLNALSNFIPSDERVITIEDSAELNISGVPNLVRLETRNATASSDKEINMQSLIKSSLRMRPDRIVVGEVRGAEALDMLQAMNTGHDGSLSTGHANTAEDMLSRLETMVLRGAADLPLKAVRKQITSAIDIIIHLSRLRDHSRKTVTIAEIIGLDKDDNYIINPLFEFKEDASSTVQKVSGQLKRSDKEMIKTEKLFRAGYTEADLI
ncbi:MAG: CpaF family protein [Ruminococcaceae bacterium]|nr:CpaF family protein [Oscillospiraceae bacterium]